MNLMSERKRGAGDDVKAIDQNNSKDGSNRDKLFKMRLCWYGDLLIGLVSFFLFQYIRVFFSSFSVHI